MLGGPVVGRMGCNDRMPSMSDSVRTLRLYYEPRTTATASANYCKHPLAATAAYSPRSRSPSRGPRRYVPDRPPVFSHRATSPITMDRSTDLHMS